MTLSSGRLFRLLAALMALALLAAACGSDDDDDASGSDAETETDDAGSDDGSDDDADSSDDSGDDGSDDGSDEGTDDGDSMGADSSLDPIRVGLIAQEDELLAFPEVRAASQAFVDYFNAEDGGAGGHPMELVVCGAGDTPESHVACAQEFVNDDSINLVVSGGFLANSAAASAVLAEAGLPVLVLGNDFVDYLVPGVFSFDPGLPGLAQVFFVFMSQTRGDETVTLFIADDPAFEPFIPALQAIGESNGVAVTEVVPLGFEPDLTGPVSAADTTNDGWMFVLADGAQCSASAAAVATIGYEGNLYANDLCMSQEVIEAGEVDGWSGPIVSSAPTVDGGDDVDLINRVFADYGGDGVQTAGLAGWAVAQMYVARDVLVAAGGVDATRESVLVALGAYSSDSIPGMPAVSCPGPSAWVGACNMAPLMVTVDGGQLTSPDGFVQLDFAELDFLLE